jgi:hypothetical protein
MKITVKTVSKEEYAIELAASATVGDLKKAACEKMSTASGCLTLVHLGTVLSDDCKTLAEHNIAEGAMLVAVIKVRICSASVRVRVWWGLGVMNTEVRCLTCFILCDSVYILCS